MEKFQDYMIAWGEDDGSLERKVREKIQQGWTPIGGVCVTQDPLRGNKLGFFQAIAK